ncbi:MAG TPA: glycosyltransferase [Ktedonobacteraceae bacterium]|nr:glycosyltransferase [Ktedonobacteraceae bacterium]
MRNALTLTAFGNTIQLTRRTRFLLYCHDTFGLGHIRRTLSLAASFTSLLPNAEVLIVTGSPLAHAFTLPPHVDYIKLPAVTKMGNGTYRALHLDMEFASIRDLRAAMLRDIAEAYMPDVFLVDHAPQGLKGEVLPTLAMLRTSNPTCLRVLGLRDIVDERAITRHAWMREGIYNTLEQNYDLILVYGSQHLYDIGQEYALPPTVEQRVHYCGYLDRVTDAHSGNTSDTLPRRVAAVRSSLTQGTEPLIVLTAGGGGDGFPLMHTYLSGLQQLPSNPFTSVLVTGPLMDQQEQRELHALAAAFPPGKVHIEKFLADPLPLLGAADLVVTMAGYNTVCELLALQQRMLLVPRVVPRQEQLVRANLLAQHGLAHILHPDQLTPQHLLESVIHALAQPHPQTRQLSEKDITFEGQKMATETIIDRLTRLQHQQSMMEQDRLIAQIS